MQRTSPHAGREPTILYKVPWGRSWRKASDGAWRRAGPFDGQTHTLGIHRTPEALNDEPTISHLDGGGRSDPSETAWPPSSLRMRGDGLRRGETQHQPSRHVWREHRPVELRRFEPGAVVVEATACPFRRGAPTRSLRAQPGSDAIIDDFARLVDDSNATSLVPNCSEACAQCA